MGLTFENLIAHNKRTSLALVIALVIFTALLGGLFGTVYAGTSQRLLWGIVPFGAALGGTAALSGALISYAVGDRIILGLTDAHPLSREQDLELFNVVEEMAIAAGVPCPKVYLIDDPSPNAFATGRDPSHAAIGITSGLRQKLTRDELQAVIAHEMAHIRNFDTRLMMLVGVFAGFIILIADFFMRSARLSSASSRSNSSDSAGAFGKLAPAMVLVAWILAAVFALIAPLVARLLKLAVSREREYLADATGVKLCRNPLALASALKKIAADPVPLRNKSQALQHLYILNPDSIERGRLQLDSMWATHPPLRKRIARLTTLAGAVGETLAPLS